MRRTRLALATAALYTMLSPAVHADEATLQAEVDALHAEVAALKDEVRQIHAERTQAVSTVANRAAAAAPNAGSAPPAVAIAESSGTSLWGYGQIDYNRPTAQAAAAQADLSRAVIGFNHVFDEATRVYGELEWEHAIASADDRGETEVEQLYVEHALASNVGVRAGLMLVPLGLLNEHHEPTQFYGVERNFVETAIIPSTWREGGVAGYGSTDSGLSWNIGIGTGPDLSKWNPASADGRESPLGSIHQELQLAKAHDLSVYGAANWQGIPGFTVGGGVFTGKIGQRTPGFSANNARLVLGEAHLRWQPGPFDFAALYTRGTISNTQALNASFTDALTPVPKSFWGGYAQGAWRALEWNQSSLAPFLRYEMFNTGAAYAAQPQGLGSPPRPTERVWTVGTNYYLNPNVVFKLDYQNFNRDDLALGYGHRFDLGIGYQF